MLNRIKRFAAFALLHFAVVDSISGFSGHHSGTKTATATTRSSLPEEPAFWCPRPRSQRKKIRFLSVQRSELPDSDPAARRVTTLPELAWIPSIVLSWLGLGNRIKRRHLSRSSFERSQCMSQDRTDDGKNRKRRKGTEGGRLLHVEQGKRGIRRQLQDHIRDWGVSDRDAGVHFCRVHCARDEGGGVTRQEEH